MKNHKKARQPTICFSNSLPLVSFLSDKISILIEEAKWLLDDAKQSFSLGSRTSRTLRMQQTVKKSIQVSYRAKL